MSGALPPNYGAPPPPPRVWSETSNASCTYRLRFPPSACFCLASALNASRWPPVLRVSGLSVERHVLRACTRLRRSLGDSLPAIRQNISCNGDVHIITWSPRHSGPTLALQHSGPCRLQCVPAVKNQNQPKVVFKN